MKILRNLVSKHIYGYEHDWTNDFYLTFYDSKGQSLSPEMMSGIYASPISSNITKGQNPNSNQPFCATHTDQHEIHNCWVVGHKHSTSVANWFSDPIQGGHGAAIGIRSDYDQKTQTGLPETMNFGVQCTLYITINNERFSTNYTWGMVGPDKWKVFRHLVQDVAKDVFKDAVMEELEVPEQIAETVSAMDAASDTKDFLGALSDNYYFAVTSSAEVRKINWGDKRGKDQSAIITPLIDREGNVSDHYVLFKIGDTYDEIQVFLVQS